MAGWQYSSHPAVLAGLLPALEHCSINMEGLNIQFNRFGLTYLALQRYKAKKFQESDPAEEVLFSEHSKLAFRT